eukprot:9477909-Pyramimonas_sp.AAC.1
MSLTVGMAGLQPEGEMATPESDSGERSKSFQSDSNDGTESDDDKRRPQGSARQGIDAEGSRLRGPSGKDVNHSGVASPNGNPGVGKKSKKKVGSHSDGDSAQSAGRHTDGVAAATAAAKNPGWTRVIPKRRLGQS